MNFIYFLFVLYSKNIRKLALRFSRFIVVLTSFMLFSCQNEHERVLLFIGDSIVSRWDVQDGFSSYKTVNMGKGGEGIEYVKSLKGIGSEKNCVFLFGTNDINFWDDEYSEKYINAIENIGSANVYVISILPRSKGIDLESIKNLNLKIKNQVILHGWKYIDVFDLFLSNGNSLNLEYYTDGIHLSEKGYMVLTSVLRKELR